MVFLVWHCLFLGCDSFSGSAWWHMCKEQVYLGVFVSGFAHVLAFLVLTVGFVSDATAVVGLY